MRQVYLFHCPSSRKVNVRGRCARLGGMHDEEVSLVVGQLKDRRSESHDLAFLDCFGNQIARRRFEQVSFSGYVLDANGFGQFNPRVALVGSLLDAAACGLTVEVRVGRTVEARIGDERVSVNVLLIG